MKQCPTCKRDLKDQLSFCPYDGQALTDKAEQTDSLVGILLDDKYRLEQMVGQGGMGTVYKAVHVEMENTVAVKVLHPHLASDRLAVERFRREARAAAQIRHPNAVAVTDFGVSKEEDVAYLVMEFLEGQDLRDRIRKQEQMDPKQTSEILEQVCSAVHAAHVKGIIHRDLKPDNIWILKAEDIKDRVKVLDFGIAKLKVSAEGNTLTQKGMIVGTPYYMSPEQCRGEELDAGSDIYSLGVILYEMLAGRVPFEGSTPLAVVLKHNNEAPKPLRMWRPDLSEEVEAVVLRALSKNRKERQESALDLAQEFEDAVSGVAHPIGVRDSSDNLPQSTAPVKSYRPEDKGNQSPVANATRAYDKKFGVTPEPATKKRGEAVTVKTPKLKPAAAKSRAVAAGVGAQPEKVPTPAPDPLIQSDVGKTGLLSGRNKVIAAAALVVVVGLVVWFLFLRSKPVVEQATDGQAQTEPTAASVPVGMKLIKGGTYLMGTDDPSARAEWRPAHPETVGDFYLDEYEVTNEDYARFVRIKSHPAPPHWKNGVFPSGESKLPVYNVSWFDAKAYAEWAGKRLPTEAEWELAARGMTRKGIYPWGNEWSEELSNSRADGRELPVAVGSYRRGDSEYGIADLAGNVSEWVANDYAPYPGSKARPDPGFKVYRGGSYKHVKEESTTFARWTDLPQAQLNWVGFRCAKDVPK